MNNFRNLTREQQIAVIEQLVNKMGLPAQATEKDYEDMQNTMIYGKSPTFNELTSRIKQLEEKIRQTDTCA